MSLCWISHCLLLIVHQWDRPGKICAVLVEGALIIWESARWLRKVQNSHAAKLKNFIFFAVEIVQG